MADLGDLDHAYGEDLNATASGDIAVVTKSARTVQRIIRRLLTPPTQETSSYPWNPKFGVGLGSRIGDDLDIRGIAADVRSQMLLEPTVSKTPAPTVSVESFELGATIDVKFQDRSGQPQTFGFNLVP